jgi:UDP-glucose 4-epimerase
VIYLDTGCFVKLYYPEADSAQAIAMCEKITGKKIPAIEKPCRAGDPPRLVAAANKAFNELGWKPQYPKLEDIVATAWAWHKKHPTGYAD